MIQINNKLFAYTFWFIVIAEILSVLGHLYSTVNTIVFAVIMITILAISFWKIKYAFYIAAVELFIGSFGYLFFVDFDEFRFSIRLAIFLALSVGWIFHVLKKRKIEFFSTKFTLPLILLSCMLLLGVVSGLIRNHSPRDVFFDVNAYLFFGLFIIAFTVIRSRKHIIELLQLLFAAVTTVCIKTIFLLFYFSHQTDSDLFRFMYTWVRDTRIGEIAPIVQNYYRIFFQGHIWVLFAMIITVCLILLVDKKEYSKRIYRYMWIITLLCSTTLIISYSRSFWLAILIVGMLGLFYLIKKEHFGVKRLSKIFGVIIGIVIFELLLITAIVNVKLPGGTGGSISAVSLVQDRLTSTDEAAVKSRFELLGPLVNKIIERPFIGSGFATEVTYQTLDPRTKDLDGGWYTSYSFEWGYLDILVKIGLAGLLAYFFLIWRIWKYSLCTLRNKQFPIFYYVLILALQFSLLALLVIHITTPYLNHPLGIFLVIMFAVILHAVNNDNTVNTDAKSDILAT